MRGGFAPEGFRTRWPDTGEPWSISPNLGDGELSVAPGRLALPILEASGSVWMLDNVDR
jgi:hypothetical protein